MACTYCGDLPRYSMELEAAWSVLDKVREMDTITVTISQLPGRTEWTVLFSAGSVHATVTDSLPKALCEAALLWIGT